MEPNTSNTMKCTVVNSISAKPHNTKFIVCSRQPQPLLGQLGHPSSTETGFISLNANCLNVDENLHLTVFSEGLGTLTSPGGDL